MTQHLPPGVTAKSFSAALTALRDIVGSDWVHASLEDGLAGYLDQMSPEPPEARIPSAAVAPASVEELQRVVRLCHQRSIPVWYYGTGKNFGYGGPAVKLTGYLVIDMKRMDRILEVDEASGYALVEPGVSYLQLYQHLQQIGSNLWIDCAAPAWGGIIGNAMEHGAGYTPYGDHYLFSCGMEVMLADGSLVRTGMGAMPNSRSWQLFKYGYGPYLDGMFTQGNLGIVTKMGIWLMPRPPAYKPFLFTFANEQDVGQIMEVMRPLKVSLVYQNAAVLEHVSYSAGVQAVRSDYWTEKSPMPREAWAQIVRDLDIGWWNLYGAVYGLPENVEIQWGIIRDAFMQIKGARHFLERPPEDVGWAYRHKLMQGIPNMTEFNIVNWRGGGHINFTPIAPMRGAVALRAMDIIREVQERHGFDYMTEYVATFRGLIKLLMIMFDPRDPEDARRAYACADEILRVCADLGFGELKAHLSFMDLVQGFYKANDGGLQTTLQKLKDGLDPKGILAPGKSGIWPSHWTPELGPVTRET
ncbi:MAG: FAD-binding oxidoreductase [Pseudomonadota bacterium]|nr:FAD-binding oxidoreductase [Pseudomonadota bacterium]